ncbi:transporter [bacterium]|nr:transporter [bacterium]
MRSLKFIPLGLVAAAGLAGVCVNPAQAHEPVFSVGPETIYAGGVGIESEFEIERGDDERLLAMHYEIIYGYTKDLSLTLSIPHIIGRKLEGNTSSGMGDIQFRGKYALFKRDYLGAQDKVTAIFGVKLPTGRDTAEPPLGSGAIDVMLGVSAGHESRTWYRFATLRYLARNSSGGMSPGDRFMYDAAFGLRPKQSEYLEADFVALLELNGEYEFAGKSDGIKQADSGGNTIWLGPSALWSKRNVMVKGGLQFPILQNLRGNQGGDDFRAVIAVEYHF